MSLEVGHLTGNATLSRFYFKCDNGECANIAYGFISTSRYPYSKVSIFKIWLTCGGSAAAK